MTRSAQPTARARYARWVPLLVLAFIGLAILVPSVVKRGDNNRLAPIGLPASPDPPAAIPLRATMPKERSPSVDTLVLYDRTGRWGWLGELYATMTANLVSHFGAWTAQPVATYRPGEIARHDATIYIGSTYNERLPASFLHDVLNAKRRVLWAGLNIGQLKQRAGDFTARYGWEPRLLDRSPITRVRYKGATLSRWSHKTNGVMRCDVVDPSRAAVLAQAIHKDGSTIPWAVRSGRLTYIAEVPLSYISETDRVLAFTDLLFGAIAPKTPPRHRALVRLEDINPLNDPQELRDAADFLHSRGIPFGFGVSPRYRDPTGDQNGGEPQDVRLRDAPKLAGAIRYLIRRGGVLVEHGYTHQWDGGVNPYDGATGDDVEFFRVVQRPDQTLDYRGPLPNESVGWVDRRLALANREFQAAGLPQPRIFEFPHYAASRSAYKAAARRFSTRWERSLYFPGQLSGHAPARARLASQFFPFVVRDVYGTKVLPENLGAIEPHAWHQYKPRLPADVIAAAKANLVVRDGVVGFFFHPFLDLRYLRQTVAGIQRLGYKFVSPASL